MRETYKGPMGIFEGYGECDANPEPTPGIPDAAVEAARRVINSAGHPIYDAGVRAALAAAAPHMRAPEPARVASVAEASWTWGEASAVADILRACISVEETGDLYGIMTAANTVCARHAAKDARIAELEKALEPFSSQNITVCGGVVHGLNPADLRRAADVMAQSPSQSPSSGRPSSPVTGPSTEASWP